MRKIDLFNKYIEVNHKNWIDFDKQFVSYVLALINAKLSINTELFYDYYTRLYNADYIGDSLELKISHKIERLEIGLEWICEMIKYLEDRPEPARAEDVSTLDFFLLDPHPTLSTDIDKNSFFDLVVEITDTRKAFPWNEIECKVKSEIDRKTIKNAYHWISIVYKQWKEIRPKC